jgi:hypothetical protein
MPDISAADFSFAALAVVATLGVAVQHSLWRRPGDKVLSPFAVSVGGVVVLSIAGCAAHIHATCEGVPDCASWLPMLVLLGGFKVRGTMCGVRQPACSLAGATVPRASHSQRVSMAPIRPDSPLIVGSVDRP